MNEKDIVEILVDTYNLTYEFCSNRQNCNKCIFKTSKRSQCLGEDFYKILREINNNYKRLKEEK